MKTAVITGSARGLGFELAKNFRKNGYNVVLNDVNEAGVLASADELRSTIEGAGGVIGTKCDVTVRSDCDALAEKAAAEFGAIDIWINNAGVNQAEKFAWELEEREVEFLLNVDLKGAINGSSAAMRTMIRQGHGAIYNVEGFGSNDAYQPYLAVYGTAKRAVTYFTGALANEIKEKNLPVIAGKLSPGIMITDFLTSSNGKDGTVALSDRVKKVYNILGDYPDVIAEHLVKKMLTNTKNDVRIEWLTTAKASWRFMTAAFNKRDFFSGK